jgi:hypothetical protein
MSEGRFPDPQAFGLELPTTFAQIDKKDEVFVRPTKDLHPATEEL